MIGKTRAYGNINERWTLNFPLEFLFFVCVWNESLIEAWKWKVFLHKGTLFVPRWCLLANSRTCSSVKKTFTKHFLKTCYMTLYSYICSFVPFILNKLDVEKLRLWNWLLSLELTIRAIAALSFKSISL